MRNPSKRATAESLLEDEWFVDNHIGELDTAQAIVKAWLLENVTNSPHFKGPTDAVTPHAGALHHAGDHLFEEGVKDHPLLSPRLRRGDSQKMEESINSKEDSIKTEISVERAVPLYWVALGAAKAPMVVTVVSHRRKLYLMQRHMRKQCAKY